MLYLFALVLWMGFPEWSCNVFTRKYLEDLQVHNCLAAVGCSAQMKGAYYDPMISLQIGLAF